MIDYAQFTADYPEFKDVNVYPQSGVNYWLNLSGQLLNPDRLGQPAAAGAALTLFDLATELFIAHNLVIEKRNLEAAQAGGDPGAQVGPVNSKSVGPVSVGYDTSAGIVPEAGHWNLTTYGTRLLALLNMAGAGPVYVGVGANPNPFGAWPGPYPYPAPTSFS